MYDKQVVLDILNQIHKAIQRIIRRSGPITKVEDFTNSPDGQEKLDGICMLIIAIGESLKNIDKITNNELLPKYPEIDWKGVKGMRDIITHHYFDIDEEEIFWVCKHQIRPLSDTIAKMIEDLK
ncbi:MAG: DUF86 domain-containing protein [Candidatus Scalindua sp.]